jgi:arylsulfatase A-like enzyme
MDRRAFLSLPMSAAAQSRRPNFLVILADDIGARELACYGHPKHRTPNLDHLARTGVQFKTCYATPICHPTRVEIMTGQYGARNGVYNFANRRGGPAHDSPVEDMRNHHTFAQMLQSQGYATALAGKWQLSGTHPTIVHETGFDEYCIWAFENYVAKEDRPRYRARERYWHPAVMRNGKLLDTTINDYGPHLYSEFLMDFMKRNRERPFLAYYPMALTHGPHVPTPDTVRGDGEKFTANKARNYQSNVEYMDKIVGRLVKALDDNGLRDNTVILFTGDNGTAGEGKGDGTELGARVPMIANCPGMVRARGASDELVDLSDILPTLAEFAGAPLPKGRRIDGRSYAGYLRGTQPAPREWIHSFIGDRRILRTKRYLLEDNSPRRWGRLYDCGSSRDGSGYRDVTSSDEADVRAITARFKELLKDLPAPDIAVDGHPAALKTP